ncbi:MULTISPECIES: preprotein translocase subunit SecG [unclassified Paracoccus (in: a-proteobacteria)]|uniref:preprotein translocase subunit SecG n=1 Tax=unclassified Paracoccus (in: a-proteobacteria) TaxID=2688777 RepID=UPI0016008D32|nr:preprotein translocase subunit SecG [Paracoccus sp. MC1862]MBB1490871.1 preprotein translocase subunit SecG [Paracoccus sp. MC1854]MBB1497785.1 preprotein translocase subunit SecG [Paracoccus sp. MC1862]QQO45266.1 preprotein translocase subunit SecG [Paracoccus sp. MC1862]
MENVVLTVHLVLALLLIGVVLLQRSEGGGLGMGGGGGGVMTGRQAANALTKATWIIAAAFLVTSIALTVIAARNSVGASVVDRIAPMGTPAPATGLPNLPAYTPPPAAGQPVLPPGAASAPVTAPAEGPVTPPEPAASVPADAPAAAEAAAPAGSAGNVTTQTVPIAPAPAN